MFGRNVRCGRGLQGGGRDRAAAGGRDRRLFKFAVCGCWVVCMDCLAPEPVELDRWVSSTEGHEVRHGAPTKPKKVRNACAFAAPSEVERRLNRLKRRNDVVNLVRTCSHEGSNLKPPVTFY